MSERLTDFPLPPYSYVTGHYPHPLRDANGHGCPGPSAERPPTASSWPTCSAYLWGIDLFNAGFYWEAHEAWEGVWHAAERTGAVADWCKGLIKLAAAGVKAREGREDGVRRHAVRARQLFQGVVSEIDAPTFLGLKGKSLIFLSDNVSQRAAPIAQAACRDITQVVLPTIAIDGQAEW